MAISKLPNLEEKIVFFFPPEGCFLDKCLKWCRFEEIMRRFFPPDERRLVMASKALVKSLRAKVDLCGNASGRKCRQVFTNTIRNSVKTRDLAFKNFGRKCCKKTVDSIVVSEKIITFASQ